ncbi:sigma factor [Streptomyces sp. NPDC088785]|uniref:sigma factor n=1 Tax=Streptomyces sp. NPDC088785 TaxID=3365897 RepID=UPI003807B323
MNEENFGARLGAEAFEAHHPHLRAVTHRRLGSLAEAESAVQETWVHACAADAGDVRNTGPLPVWIRNRAYRLVLLQGPDEPALSREAAQNDRGVADPHQWCQASPCTL